MPSGKPTKSKKESTLLTTFSCRLIAPRTAQYQLSRSILRQLFSLLLRLRIYTRLSRRKSRLLSRNNTHPRKTTGKAKNLPLCIANMAQACQFFTTGAVKQTETSEILDYLEVILGITSLVWRYKPKNHGWIGWSSYGFVLPPGLTRVCQVHNYLIWSFLSLNQTCSH